MVYNTSLKAEQSCTKHSLVDLQTFIHEDVYNSSDDVLVTTYYYTFAWYEIPPPLPPTNTTYHTQWNKKQYWSSLPNGQQSPQEHKVPVLFDEASEASDNTPEGEGDDQPDNSVAIVGQESGEDTG